LLSVPRVFGTTLETIPAEVPYLRADPARVEAWHRELGPDGFKIGIAWQGNIGHAKDSYRSVPLVRFAGLAAVPGVRLFSLQKGAGSEQLAEAPFAVTALGERLHDFAETAAAVQALDLVVSVDTALAHLAGALAVPAWVALPFAPDWRWLLQREDSPWYPTLRLFRQERPGDWDDVFARLTAAVAERLSRPGLRQPIRVPVSPAELLDRIARLETRTNGAAAAELARLTAVRARALQEPAALAGLIAELREAHAALVQLESAVQDCRRNGGAEDRLGELARAIYWKNDRRAAVKRQINELLGGAPVDDPTAYYECSPAPDEAWPAAGPESHPP
jgi:hypothetical protein